MRFFFLSPTVISQRSGEISLLSKEKDFALRCTSFEIMAKISVILQRSGEILSFLKRGDFSLRFTPIEITGKMKTSYHYPTVIRSEAEKSH
ncbi:MAG TPA: hypothetical protein PK110_07520 [Niabella sp.]|nr:hypothetical protein [Niabella sp.]